MSVKHWAPFLAYSWNLKVVCYFACKITWIKWLYEENSLHFVAKAITRKSDLRICWLVAGTMEKATAPHSSALAWKIPWTEEPGGLQSMGSLSRTGLSDFTFTFHFHALEKEMATRSSLLAWRIPGTGEPGGLPSMGSKRVGHDWRDLAAAASTILPCRSC